MEHRHKAAQNKLQGQSVDRETGMPLKLADEYISSPADLIRTNVFQVSRR